MSIIIGVISQKGGVGKSTISRLIAREYAAAGWNVKIADLDISQGTSFNWQSRRLANAIEPTVAVERFGTVEQALKVAAHYDLMVMDSPPHSTSGTLRVAKASSLLVLPTGLALDDLEPTVLLGHELVREGIPKDRLRVIFTRVGDSDAELAEARDYVAKAGYVALASVLPEKVAYRRANDEGRSLSETRFSTLNGHADAIVQELVDTLSASAKTEAA